MQIIKNRVNVLYILKSGSQFERNIPQINEENL